MRQANNVVFVGRLELLCRFKDAVLDVNLESWLAGWLLAIPIEHIGGMWIDAAHSAVRAHTFSQMCWMRTSLLRFNANHTAHSSSKEIGLYFL